MALYTQFALSFANYLANSAGQYLNGGTILLYDGDMPSTPEEDVTTQVLLASLSIPEDAFQGGTDTPEDGVLRITAVMSGSVIASGTPTWARISGWPGGAMDVTVGDTEDYTIHLDTSTLVAGDIVTITLLSIYFI